jgi:uncharacterized protein YcbK (DUF882 family)
LILLDGRYGGRRSAPPAIEHSASTEAKAGFPMIDRRKLLLGSAAAAAALVAPQVRADPGSSSCHWPPPAWAQNGFPSRRWVNIVFVHTGEHFKNIYVEDGTYIMPAVQQFSWTCRDYRANEWKFIDPRLMDLLFVLHWKYCKDEIKILSGYRTLQTNAQLEGAALNSQHLQAKALDIHLPDVDNDAVARDFRLIVDGGVGMYPGREFTHMDMGSLRRWVG